MFKRLTLTLTAFLLIVGCGETPADPNLTTEADLAKSLDELAYQGMIESLDPQPGGERPEVSTIQFPALAPGAGGDLISNGSFETGDFSGWTVTTVGTPFRPWAVTPGGFGSGFGMAPTMPQDGGFVAWNGFDGAGPMSFHLSQDVALPKNGSAVLRWQDRVQWNFGLGGVASLPRTYTVEVQDPNSGGVLATLRSFSTGTQAQNVTGDTGWQTHIVDLNSFRGSTVRIAFNEQIPQSFTGPGQIEFDAISLLSGEAGPVTQSVTGGWAISGDRTFAFTAREYSDGSVEGQWQRVNQALDTKGHGEVVCLSVVGNQAWIGTITTKGPQEGNEGGFRVVDNGEGAKAAPDQASFQFVNLGPGGAYDYCRTTPGTPSLQIVESGNIQIK